MFEQKKWSRISRHASFPIFTNFSLIKQTWDEKETTGRKRGLDIANLYIAKAIIHDKIVADYFRVWQEKHLPIASPLSLAADRFTAGNSNCAFISDWLLRWNREASGYTSDKWWIGNKWGISAGNIRDIKKEPPSTRHPRRHPFRDGPLPHPTAISVISTDWNPTPSNYSYRAKPVGELCRGLGFFFRASLCRDFSATISSMRTTNSFILRPFFPLWSLLFRKEFFNENNKP